MEMENNNIILNKREYAGKTKRFPAATKEWFNSIYSYNKNTVKSLPSNDVYVAKLIKSYFNLFNKNFEKRAKLEVARLKVRKNGMHRILVGKPEFKHTNDKVIITLFVFNQELVSLKKRLRSFNLLKYLDIFFGSLSSKSAGIRPKYKLQNFKNTCNKFLKRINILNSKYINNLKYSFFLIEKIPVFYSIRNILGNIILYLRVKRLIYLNQYKFKSIHILSLKHLIQKVYGKTVEFNIVSLNRYHLNSSILTDIMAKKLKNRNNRILRVIDNVLTRITLPFTRRLDYPGKELKVLNLQNYIIRKNLDGAFINRYFKLIPFLSVKDKNYLSNNNDVKKLILKKIINDKLNILLKSLYPKQYTMSLSKNNKLYVRLRNLENTMLDNLKNKMISGVRIEASGRLSKRLIASRAVFKMRQRGSIRNITSSYQNIPSVLLRGYLTSNLDFSKSRNRTPTGAFGLKGWISSV